MALAEELVAAAIAEAEAKRIATSPVTIYNDKHIITK
jgi:hypothetical protein